MRSYVMMICQHNSCTCNKLSVNSFKTGPLFTLTPQTGDHFNHTALALVLKHAPGLVSNIAYSIPTINRLNTFITLPLYVSLIFFVFHLQN